MRACIFILLFLVPLSTSAATSGMSANVVKADFSDSTFLLSEDSQNIELEIILRNSGNLAGESVSFFVMYPNTYQYEGTTHDIGVIHTSGSSFGQIIEWELEGVEPQQTHDAQMHFMSTDASTGTVVFSIAIVSKVSLPVHKEIVLILDKSNGDQSINFIQIMINNMYLKYHYFTRWIRDFFS